MDVNYITVSSKKLSSVPIKNGQLIALMDKDAWFYDMGGLRHGVTGKRVVAELPQDTSDLYPDTLVIVTEGDTKGIFLWTGVEFSLIASANTDSHVKTDKSDADKIYITGTDYTDDEAISTLLKNLDVYIEGKTGKIHALGFTGGSADSALSADKALEANKATSDGSGNEITKTYIKNISIEGDVVTITYGDDSTSTEQTLNTDTHAVTKIVVGPKEDSKEDGAASDGEVHINLFDDDEQRSSHVIQGEGATSVTSDVHGNIKISSENTWQPNTATQGGYVAKGEPNKVWSTDNTGAPAWREQESKYVHPDSGVKAGTYTKVTVDIQGHVTKGENPTTLSDYGITDGLPIIMLGAGSDLDKLTDSAVYIGTADSTITNKPVDTNQFGMLVISEDRNDPSNAVIQKFFCPDGQYSRTSVGGTFTNWSKDKLTDTVYVHPTTPGNLHIPSGGTSGQILVWNADGEAEWGNPEAVAVAVMEGSTEEHAGKAGIVPAPEAGPATSYLRNDGVWSTPSDTKYNDFTGTDGTTGGQSGLVPAPEEADLNKFLASDGTWKSLPDVNITPQWEDFPEN